ncbi:MAG TPA: guanylate kinase [Caulobacteraceae bacterium]|nr:guanylate kinase [Caulobacteraceae bacterium]
MSSERRGLMLVVSSPSGAGKTTLCNRLLAASPDLVLSISATTRPPRRGEVDGREYHFIDRTAFDAMVSEDAFLEWAEVHEHRYGTPRAAVARALESGKDVLFDIDWQGAAQIAAAAPGEAVRVFVLPPSIADLAVRLHGRGQDDEDVIRRRLARAYGEIAHWIEYDYVLVNQDLDRAFEALAAVYQAERLKRLRNPWLKGFVDHLLEQTLPSR